MNMKRTWQGNETIKDTKTHKNKGQKKGLSLIFKQGTIKDYMMQKQEHKNKNMRWAR